MEQFDAIVAQFDLLWTEALQIWASGGWAMWVIAVIALVLFSLGVHVYLGLRAKGFRSVPEETWRRWIEFPTERRGPIGDLLDYTSQGETLEDTVRLFGQLREAETAPFERDLRVMKVCVSAAPLVGLLGTVTGMLATFGALAAGSGGDKTMGQVAGGISEALVTTETGLVIALPGLLFQYQIGRGFERYKAFLAHLETVCTQLQFRRERRDVVESARHAALVHIKERLRQAVS